MKVIAFPFFFGFFTTVSAVFFPCLLVFCCSSPGWETISSSIDSTMIHAVPSHCVLSKSFSLPVSNGPVGHLGFSVDFVDVLCLDPLVCVRSSLLSGDLNFSADGEFLDVV